MNNEPVAWINLDRFKDEALYLADCVSENKVDNMGITMPLYAHPYKPSKSEVDALLDNADYVIGTMREEIEKLKTKTLTDGEILDIYLNLTNGNKDLDILEFARKILRKAQEK